MFPSIYLKLSVLLLILNEITATENPSVNTPNGAINGKLEKTSFSNTSYYAFYSVRYAEPPVGSLRFQAPVPVKPWEDVYDATTEKSRCFQVSSADWPDENEDCLFLNIFSKTLPANSNNQLLPVMFFIHGGGFVRGSGLVKYGLGPEFFMEHDVILITVNYRLGPFGFFSTGDGVIPGNAGLKDIHLALEWVNTNIEHFGGDRQKVTIFGHSAGGAAVSYQLLNPQSKGLFRAAILMSGTSMNPWAYQRDQSNITYETAALIDPAWRSSENRNSTALFEFLRRLDAEQIDRASRVYEKAADDTGLRQLQQGFFYAPVVERHENRPFLTKVPYESFKNGNYVQVPIMIGIVAEEGLIAMQSTVLYIPTNKCFG